MNCYLAPSILSADFARLGDQVKLVGEAGAQYVHIDVMDGTFVPQITLGSPVISCIRKVTDAVFDVHLMIQHPELHIEAMAKAGADIITVHAEAALHLDRVLDQIHQAGAKAGVALNPGTPLTELDYVLDKTDMVLLMTVNPGFGGQSYIPAVTEKIRTLRGRFIREGRDIDIEVDGGINAKTIRTVLDAGANVLVMGSAIYGAEDIPGEIGRTLAVFEEYKQSAEK